MRNGTAVRNPRKMCVGNGEMSVLCPYLYMIDGAEGLAVYWGV
jgi:hypothetical protein